MFNYDWDFFGIDWFTTSEPSEEKDVWTSAPRIDKFTPAQRHKIQSLRENAEDVEFEEINPNKDK